MYGYAIMVKYSFLENEALYGFYDTEESAQSTFSYCEKYRKELLEKGEKPTEYRMVRAELNELPDDYDAEQEKTMERIRTADEVHSANSYLDHPALS